GSVGQLRERRQPPRVGPGRERLLELLRGHTQRPGVEPESLLDPTRFRHTLRTQTDHANAMRCELDGETSSERLHGRHRRTGAPHEWRAGTRGSSGDGHDHSRSVWNHAPRGQARGQKVRPRVGRDRQGELLDIQLDQGRPILRVRDADRVERDIDPSRPVDDGLEVRAHGLFVEGVHFRGRGESSGGSDFPGDGFDRRLAAPCQKELRPLAREGAGDRSADRASGAVDYGVLVLQQQGVLLPIPNYFEGFLTKSWASTGMTTTVKGVPASSLTCGKGLPNSLPPTIELS